MKRTAALVVCGFFLLTLAAGCEKSGTGTGTSEEADMGANTEAAATAGDEEGAAATTAKNYDPCALVTQAEAEAILGGPVTIAQHDTQPINATGMKICNYDGDAKGHVQLSIHEQALMTNGSTVQELYDNSKALIGNAVVVTGVGDESFYAPPPTALQLYTLVKDKGVMLITAVFVSGATVDTKIDFDKQVALKAITRL